jgi:hypothetical protein
MLTYFLNLLRPNTPRPTKPEPISKSVAGSGTWIPPTSGSETSEVAGVEVDVVEEKLDLLPVIVGSSDEGQPTITKNIITKHKTINNFFILTLP